MGRRAERPHRRLVRALSSVRVRAFLALGVLVGLGAVSTTAYWTDQATLTGGTFTAGRLDIKLGNPAVDNNPPQFTTDFAMTNMVPGSIKDAPIRVTNSGSIPLVFNVTGTATNNGPGADQMGAAIRLSVYPSSSGGACTGTAIVTGVVPTGTVLPDQAQLAASATRDLCFRATLPANANTALQGRSTVVTLTFNAKQVGAP